MIRKINNRLRWLSAGITLGMWLYAYITITEAEKQEAKANTNKKFNDIVKNYGEKYNA